MPLSLKTYTLPGKTVEYPSLPVFHARFPLAVGKIVAAPTVTPESNQPANTAL